jgi:hypothetical protein
MRNTKIFHSKTFHVYTNTKISIFGLQIGHLATLFGRLIVIC